MKSYYKINRERIKARVIAWRAANPERVKKLASELLQRYKKLVYDHYGRECKCCGETEEAFLTIDHINKNGKEHRAQTGNGAAFYKSIIKFNYPPDLRVLCMNCNYGERRRPQCPHKLKGVGDELSVPAIENGPA